MGKVINLLQSKLDEIDFQQLLKVKKEYWELLKGNPFKVPPNSDSIGMLHYLKREKSPDNKIGPYQNITVFEAANRIASDLIIINGLIQLVDTGIEPTNCLMTLRLGTKHIKGKGDFTINGKEGEGFNVAASFLSNKLYKTRKKWEQKELSYIFINAEVVKDKHKTKDHRIIRVENWDQE